MACPGNCGTQETQTLGCGVQVGHLGIVPVCPGNCDTWDALALGLWSASWKPKDIPGVSR